MGHCIDAAIGLCESIFRKTHLKYIQPIIKFIQTGHFLLLVHTEIDVKGILKTIYHRNLGKRWVFEVVGSQLVYFFKKAPGS